MATTPSPTLKTEIHREKSVSSNKQKPQSLSTLRANNEQKSSLNLEIKEILSGNTGRPRI
jgi:hypothetical protein